MENNLCSDEELLAALNIQRQKGDEEVLEYSELVILYKSRLSTAQSLLYSRVDKNNHLDLQLEKIKERIQREIKESQKDGK